MTIQDQLLAAVDGQRGTQAADRLCEACVALLDVDGGTSVRRFPDLTALWHERGHADSMAKQAQGIIDG